MIELRGDGECGEVAADQPEYHGAQEARLLILLVQCVAPGEFDVLLHEVVFVGELVLVGGGDGVGSEGVILGLVGEVDVELLLEPPLGGLEGLFLADLDVAFAHDN